MRIFKQKKYDCDDGTIPFPNLQRSKNIVFCDGDGTGARFGSTRKKRE